jgi:hypothetical protein
MADFSDSMQALFRLGERLGYLTYEHFNEKLSQDDVTSEKLDVFLMELDARRIRVIDELDAPD